MLHLFIKTTAKANIHYINANFNLTFEMLQQLSACQLKLHGKYGVEANGYILVFLASFLFSLKTQGKDARIFGIRPSLPNEKMRFLSLYCQVMEVRGVD